MGDTSDAQTPELLKKALCDAGVQAACGSGPSPPSPPVPPVPPPPSPPSPPTPAPPAPTPPAPPQPTPSCRTPDVTDKCWEAMGASCKTGGTSCVLCLANPITASKTAAAGCPQNPPGKVAKCFCSQHVMETVV